MISYYGNEPLNPVVIPEPLTNNTIVDLDNPPKKADENISTLTDEDILIFGISHKGVKLKDVPASYLHWFYTNVNCYTLHTKAVLAYIKKNLNALKKEYQDGIWVRPTHLID